MIRYLSYLLILLMPRCCQFCKKTDPECGYDNAGVRLAIRQADSLRVRDTLSLIYTKYGSSVQVGKSQINPSVSYYSPSRYDVYYASNFLINLERALPGYGEQNLAELPNYQFRLIGNNKLVATIDSIVVEKKDFSDDCYSLQCSRVVSFRYNGQTVMNSDEPYKIVITN